MISQFHINEQNIFIKWKNVHTWWEESNEEILRFSNLNGQTDLYNLPILFEIWSYFFAHDYLALTSRRVVNDVYEHVFSDRFLIKMFAQSWPNFAYFKMFYLAPTIQFDVKDLHLY